jgi:hypothetical protein
MDHSYTLLPQVVEIHKILCHSTNYGIYSPHIKGLKKFSSLLPLYIYRGLQLKRTEIENEPQNEHQEKKKLLPWFYGTKRIPCKLI